MTISNALIQFVHWTIFGQNKAIHSQNKLRWFQILIWLPTTTHFIPNKHCFFFQEIQRIHRSIQMMKVNIWYWVSLIWIFVFACKTVLIAVTHKCVWLFMKIYALQTMSVIKFPIILPIQLISNSNINVHFVCYFYIVSFICAFMSKPHSIFEVSVADACL